jgi:hypothetical protein
MTILSNPGGKLGENQRPGKVGGTPPGVPHGLNQILVRIFASISTTGGSYKADQALAVEAVERLANPPGFGVRGTASQRLFDCVGRRLRMVRIEPDINLVAIVMGWSHEIALPQGFHGFLASQGGTAVSAHSCNSKSGYQNQNVIAKEFYK